MKQGTYEVLVISEVGARNARALHERSVVAAFPGAADPETDMTCDHVII